MDDQNIPTPPQTPPETEIKIVPANTDASTPVPPPVQMSAPAPVESAVQQPVPSSVPPPVQMPVPPAPTQNQALTAQANMAKEPLFSFKGHDMRSGKKDPLIITARREYEKPSLQAEAGMPIATPKPIIEPAKVVPIAPVINVATQIRTIGIAPAPTMPAREPHTSKALRTYEGDVAEVLAHKGTSAASIAIAENQKNTGRDSLGSTEDSRAGRKILITIISIVLIGGGGFGAYYLYSISPLAQTKPTVSQPTAAPSIVPADSQVPIPIDNMNTAGIISAIKTELAKIDPEELADMMEDPTWEDVEEETEDEKDNVQNDTTLYL